MRSPAVNLLLAAILTANLVPFNDLGPRPYDYGYFGGLWEDGSNTIPADHLAAGLERARRIQPLDANGKPSPNGKIVFLAAGFAETQKIFDDFTAAAKSDPRFKSDSVVFANAAVPGYETWRWAQPWDSNYNRVKNYVLAPARVTEKQVQAVWMEVVTNTPYSPLPIQDSDAYRLKGDIAYALRTLKEKYPNLQIVYLSSRVYGGYATTSWNPEPYAYEAVLSVRWIVVGQVLTMRQAAIGPYWDTRIGDINYEKGIAPWTTWGPYLWANGTTPRSDGLTWERADFESDGETISERGAAKASNLMLRFFLHEPTAAGWLTTGVAPARPRAVAH